MPVLCRIDADGGVVYTTLLGVVTTAALWQHCRDLKGHPAFRPDFAELVDASQATAFEVLSTSIREMAYAPPFGCGSRRAFAAPSDEAYGLARMYQSFHAGTARIEVFRDAADAYLWLGLAPGDQRGPVPTGGEQG